MVQSYPVSPWGGIEVEKKWFIQVDGNQEGPFTLSQLKGDWRLNPDTLVREEGTEKWQPAGKVKELEALFEDEEPLAPRPLPSISEKLPPDDVVLLLDDTPPNPMMWFYVVIIILLYVIFRLYID